MRTTSFFFFCRVVCATRTAGFEFRSVTNEIIAGVPCANSVFSPRCSFLPRVFSQIAVTYTVRVFLHSDAGSAIKYRAGKFAQNEARMSRFICTPKVDQLAGKKCSKRARSSPSDAALEVFNSSRDEFSHPVWPFRAQSHGSAVPLFWDTLYVA